MGSKLDEAVIAFLTQHTPAAFMDMQRHILRSELIVPLADRPVEESTPGRFRVPVICIRNEDGQGAIPAFSTMQHLLSWKPQGCLYTSITGRALIVMASGMPDIVEIVINAGDAPRGRIPRSDFSRMLNLLGEENSQESMGS